jgi:hypothetical protein
VFLSQDGDATGTAEVRLQNDVAPEPAFINGLVLQLDGKLLVTGAFTSINGEPHNSLVRLNQDGSLDSAFEAGFGPVQVNTSPFSSTASVLAVFPDGRIVVNVLDYRLDIMSILVLGAGGKFDTSFTPRIHQPNCCGTFSGATTQDGKILRKAAQDARTRALMGAEVPPMLKQLEAKWTRAHESTLAMNDGRMLFSRHLH